MRRRYLALKIENMQEIEEREFIHAVWDTVSRVFGEYGASKTDLVLISYDQSKNHGVLKCANTALEIVRASLALITEINSKPTTIHVLGVSGSLKTLRKKTSQS